MRSAMNLGPITVDDFRRIYDPSAELERGYAWYVNDHTFIQDEAGTWHLFGITQQNPFRPFEEVFFTHVTAPALEGPWHKQADVLHGPTQSPFAFSEDRRIATMLLSRRGPGIPS